MITPDLVVWILAGILLNFFLLKNDAEMKKEHFVGLGFIILLRSVSGGIVSNYLFTAGIAQIDLSTITLMGILPIFFLMISKVFNKQLT